MKIVDKIKLKDVRELSNPEMRRIEGGVSVGEYCATLRWQFSHAQQNGLNLGFYEGWWYGWSNYCM